MMFTHFFKIYNSCGRRMMNLRRKFLTLCTQKVHGEKISKQERIICPQCGRSERAECEADTKIFLSDVYKISTRARKRQVDASQYGRSMVEMLGVLAIVGVLSVGGIAGYSKAMMKYKMNKFTVAMNELLNTCIQYSGQLNSSSNAMDIDGAQYFANILYKMNALPDGIKYKNEFRLEDMFGNSVWPFAYPSRNPPLYGIGYALGTNGSNTLNSEICHQLANIAKENSSQLYSISTDNAWIATNLRLYGDAYCQDDKKCIKNMTLADIDTLCYSCQAEENCRFYFNWR